MFMPAMAAAAATDKITIALMGVRGRGRALTAAFCAQPDVNIAYVCDVDSSVVDGAYKIIEASGRARPPLVSDIRRCLDDKSVDAIVMGTPLHWHAPGTILACAAGKDVLQCVVENMSERENASHIGRRNDDGESGFG